MKTILFLLVWGSLSLLRAQSPSSALLPQVKQISTPMMKIDRVDPAVLLVEMDFNGAIPKKKLEALKVDEVVSISLVYSRYKLSAAFDQLNLNLQRMDRLYAMLPALKSNTNIQWFWVEQTGCHDAGNCMDYFHGFVINTLPSDKLKTRSMEIDVLSSYVKKYEAELDPETADREIASGKSKLIKLCDSVLRIYPSRENRMPSVGRWGEVNRQLARKLRRELRAKGNIELALIMNAKGKLRFQYPESQPADAEAILELLNAYLYKVPARYHGTKIESTVLVDLSRIGKRKMGIRAVVQPILPKGEAFDLQSFLYVMKQEISCHFLDTSIKFIPAVAPEDVVTRSFERNKAVWKNCLVATDVTGSMYPYLGQFLAWHKLNLKHSANRDFIFFQDGDYKPDLLKKTGEVGGLYYVRTGQYDSLELRMRYAMLRGGGGDCPENNIEAVLKGLSLNRHCTEVIMIADNWATPRDLSLLHKVKVPIRLILCGTGHAGFNTDYLDMVRENGGSIHTMEDDLYNLAKLSEGQTIQIGKELFRLEAGHFRSIKRVKG